MVGEREVPGTWARERLAELEVLERFDTLRQLAGHDYGSGQRAAELLRRRLELRSCGIIAGGARDAEAAELADAFERVGRPRMRRLELEGYRAGTPASSRTLETWRRVARRYSSDGA